MSIMPHRTRFNPQNRHDSTLEAARRESRRGTETRLGFIPYLRHPEFGFDMPIIVQRPAEGENRSLPPRPWIEGDASFWALPGRAIYVSHSPVTII
jgi:hypothetical protein